MENNATDDPTQDDLLPPPPAMSQQLPSGGLFTSSLTEESYHQVAGAAVKLKEFRPEYAEMWFVIAEAKFSDCRITTEETKYRKTVQALPLETAQKLHAFFSTDPGSKPKPYSRLKEALLEKYKKTTSEQLTALFESLALGDQRPSDLLSEMMQRAGNDVTEKFLEPLWLSRLPDHVSAVVSALDIPLREKGKAADKILDKVAYRNPVVAAPIQVAAAATATSDLVDVLRDFMSTMRSEIAELKRGRPEQRGNPRRGWRRPRSQSRARQNPDICWYHEKFAERSTRCQGQCKYESKN